MGAAEPLVRAVMFVLVWAVLSAPFLIIAALVVRTMKRRAALTFPGIAVVAIVLSFLVAPVPTPLITYFYPSGLLLLDLRYSAPPFIDGRPVFSTAWHARSVAATTLLLLIAAALYWRRQRFLGPARRLAPSPSVPRDNLARRLRPARIPLLLMVLAVVIYGWAVEQRSGAGQKEFSMPFPAAKGVLRSPAFRVSTSASYELVIEADRHPRVPGLGCLLGINREAGKRCEDSGPVVAVAWKVMENGGTAKSGHSDEFRQGAWGVKVSRKIGEFTGRPGVDYVVELASSKDSSALAYANPSFVARLDARAAKERIVRAALAGIIALLLAAIAIGWLIALALRSAWRSMRQGARAANPRQ
jgi:hypothetical protein